MTKNVSLYIHWPFCASKCPYCDFNSHVRASYDEDQWCQAICHELKRYHHLLNDKQELRTIFFGGGTPSLMSPNCVEKIISYAQELWSFHKNIEITLEANPGSVEAQKLSGFKLAGVNRLSLGIQALNDEALKALGRQHSYVEAMYAIELAKQTFDKFSFDLIYARSQQKLEDWQNELEEALTFKATHMSLYQLTIEPGTAFAHQFSKGELPMPSDDKSLEFFTWTNQRMHEEGLTPYEVSNYAKVGYECHHNLAYWNYQDYIGVGPGAHGRITQNGKKYGTRQHKAPETWIKSVLEDGHGDAEFHEVSKRDYLSEKLMMGLRLYDGIRLIDIPGDFLLRSRDKIKHLRNAGLIDMCDVRLRLTHKGINVLNGINNYLIN